MSQESFLNSSSSLADNAQPDARGWQSGLDALVAGRAADAVVLLRQFVAGNPNSFEGHNFLGVALSRSGQHSAAISSLQRATQLQPDSAPAFYNLGVAQLGADARDSSGAGAASLTRALQLNPNHEQARTALSKLSPDAAAAILANISSTRNAAETANRDAASWNASGAQSTSSTAANAAPTTANAISAWSSSVAPVSSSGGVATSSANIAFDGASSSAGTATVAPSQALTTGDISRAAGFGLMAALVSAIVWDKFTYYSQMKFSLIAIGIGFLVGGSVVVGGRNKTGVPLQIIGAVCAALGILLGEMLLFDDYLHDYFLRTAGLDLGFWRLLPFVIKQFPSYALAGGISIMSWLFLAVGVYEGWVIPGRKKA